MSNDAIPEYDPVSGYPVSSPPEGAETEGNPPAPNDESRHEPQPETPRWNEVYRNWKEEARANEELRQRIAELEAQTTQQPTYEQPSRQMDDEDPWGELREIIREETMKATSPIQQQFQSQQQQMEMARKVAAFKAAHPEYNDARDREILTHTMRRYGLGDNLEVGYRAAFPERFVQNAQPERSPVSDVPGTSANAPANSPEELMKRFNDPRTSAHEKAQIAQMIADMGGWGAAAAEKALGY